MPPNKIIGFRPVRVDCQHCSLARLCLPASLDQSDVSRLDKLVTARRLLRRGEHLFRVGDRVHSVYAVRSGVIKTSALTDDGDEQVMGFHLPGELVGLGAVGGERHGCTATALDTASVCDLPFHRLEELSRELPSLDEQLHRLMSQEIADEHELLLLLGKKSALERLAAFLLTLSHRLAKRGLSAREFNLSMSRKDIANYLALTLETVSRTFGHLQAQGLISVRGKHVEIEDRNGLRAVTSSSANESASRES
ncbi:MAG: fumarate/nitrate reduction transcriptional regulator Fnr [Acidiferrobacterales bacterium]